MIWLRFFWMFLNEWSVLCLFEALAALWHFISAISRNVLHTLSWKWKRGEKVGTSLKLTPLNLVVFQMPKYLQHHIEILARVIMILEGEAGSCTGQGKFSSNQLSGLSFLKSWVKSNEDPSTQVDILAADHRNPCSPLTKLQRGVVWQFQVG